MLFFVHYVFKTRSMYVVCFFAFILGGIFVFSCLKIIVCSIGFISELKTFKNNSTGENIETEFTEKNGILGKYFLLSECLIIFDVSLTDADLRLIPFSLIKSAEKTRRKNTMLIVLEIERGKIGGNEHINLFFSSEDENAQSEFNLLFLELKKVLKEN